MLPSTNMVDFDGKGPVMSTGQLGANLSSICCYMLIIFFCIKSPIKTPPVLGMLLCACCCSSSSTMKVIDDTMNRTSGKNDADAGEDAE